MNNTTTTTNVTRKDIQNAAVVIGSAASIVNKHQKIVAERDTTNNAIYKQVLTVAACAHRNAVSAAGLKAAKVKEEDATNYLFHVASVYAAAVRYADVYNGDPNKTTEITRNGKTKQVPVITAVKNMLFTEWKGYLAILAGDTVKASADDAGHLYAAVTRAVKGGLTYGAYDKADGTTGARMTSGAAINSPVSLTAFQKKLEQLAVDRLLGFDGIMSYDDAKKTAEHNATLRQDAITLHTKGAELESKKDEPKEDSKEEPNETSVPATETPAA